MKLPSSQETMQARLQLAGLADSWVILEFRNPTWEIGEECSLEEDERRDIGIDLQAAIMNLAPMAPHEQITYVANRELSPERKEAFWFDARRMGTVSMELLVAAATMDIVQAPGQVRVGFTGILPQILGGVDSRDKGLPACMTTEETFTWEASESIEVFLEHCCIALMETCALLAYAFKLREEEIIYAENGVVHMKDSDHANRT